MNWLSLVVAVRGEERVLILPRQCTCHVSIAPGVRSTATLGLVVNPKEGCVAIFILNLETKGHEVPGSRLLYLIILVAVAINKLKI